MDNHSSFFRWGFLFAILCDALKLTLQLKKTFDEGSPISEALSSFVAKQGGKKLETVFTRVPGLKPR